MTPHTEGMPLPGEPGRVWNSSISRWISRNDWDSGVTLGPTTLFCPPVPGNTVVCMAELQQPPSRLSLWAAILTAVMAAVALGMAITTLARRALLPAGLRWLPLHRCRGVRSEGLPVDVPRCSTHRADHGAGRVHSQPDCGKPRFAEPDRCRLSQRWAERFLSSTTRVSSRSSSRHCSSVRPRVCRRSQYNPHGIFIALENVGYMLLNLAFLFIGVAIARIPSRVWRAAGWVS
jgi:hypothetical protein